MQVPLLDLKAQYQTIKPELDRAVQSVVEAQEFILGPRVEHFEKEMADYLGVRFTLGVSSGTDALLLALMALDIGPGDEVITTPYTFFATAGSIWRMGAKPVFVDICPDTFNINPDLIEKKITRKTKAIMPVHLFGQSADLDPILALATKHGLKIIEDGAQAIGTRYKGKVSCTLGDVGALSFFPSKNLGGFGDGGMVVTNSEALFAKMKLLRTHGAENRYFHKMVGANFRLDALQAAVLSVKLKHLDEWTMKRQQNAAFYNNAFKNSPVRIPVVHPENGSIYNQYVVRLSNRDKVMVILNEKKIGNAIYYPLPLHLQECFTSLGYKVGDFPVSEAAAKETLALPIYPELSEEQLAFVAETVMSACLLK
ncbi:MAG: transcriptional regulator [Elusimicrobia bacterium RIFOXYB2_FULL_49_7]|nr:MAG: transcriptional regulator [Elusimicrobia bacterium RIFOXYB2_FULL_49_7]